MTLIIFDIDGTLLYSEKVDSQCFAETYQYIYGQKFPTIDWTKYPHVTDTNIFSTVIKQHFNRSSTIEEINTFQDHFVAMLKSRRARSPHEFFEVPGARRLLKKLGARNDFTIGIATGGWRRPALVKLQHIGIETTFFHMSFADGKMTREAIIQESIELAKAALDPPIQRVIYVGDAPWDVTTTRNMELDFIGVRRRGDKATLTNLGAQVVIQDYTDVNLFLESIERACPPV